VALLLGLGVWGIDEPPAEAAPPPEPSSPASEPDRPPEPKPKALESEELVDFLRSADAWDLEQARAYLEAIPAGRERELAEGVLAIYEARYADAESTLAALVAGSPSTSASERDAITSRAVYYLELARGAQLALGEAVTVRSPDGRFEAVFADPKDELLAPYLFEAMAAAYEQLGEDIGVRPEEPIRFEFYDEPGKLALVTPLTLENIYTTGTVGICKYRRIMMITPRVMVYGYGWLDTAIHEYVHYVLSMRTRNEAPVWMQEGTAKLMEARWRSEDGASPPLSPPVRKLLHDALAADELVTLEQMHPSVAMLPSQELAALAYAEAETMIGLLEEERGREGLAKLMDQVALGVDAKIAFAAAWGADFDDFFEFWKRTMAGRTADGGAQGPVSKITFGEPATSDDPQDDPSLHGDVFSHLGGGRAQQYARLGVLLTLRGHLEAAVIEYEKARSVDAKVRKDPKLARRLGELYLELGRAEEALPLLILAGEDDPEDANIAAAEARARRLTGDFEGAAGALERAIQQNPFIPGIHCDLAAVAGHEGDEATRLREAELCSE
jgi:tetratricopeptide (TPR) repeat protein